MDYFEDWRYGACLAERLTHSSFSLSRDDYWAKEFRRPYQIIVLPGYQIPSELDRTQKDSIWVTPPVSEPTVIWDGYSVEALHEVILECMDPHGQSDFIKVRMSTSSKDIGVLLQDMRPAEVMAVRPKRYVGLSPKQIENHVVDLEIWTGVFKLAFGVRGVQPGYDTIQLYGLLFDYVESSFIKSMDGRARMQNSYSIRSSFGKLRGKELLDCWSLIEKTNSFPPVFPELKRGPVGNFEAYWADTSGLYDASYPARSKWPNIDLNDARGMSEGMSYYDLVRPKQPVSRGSQGHPDGRTAMGNSPQPRGSLLSRILGRKK